jgi:nitroreductase
MRRFRLDALVEGTLERLISIVALAPSFGNSQPWRFVTVHDDTHRDAVRGEFQRCNKWERENYEGEQARLYARDPALFCCGCHPDPVAGGASRRHRVGLGIHTGADLDEIYLMCPRTGALSDICGSATHKKSTSTRNCNG